jgi:hypothetical protein
LLLHFFSYFSVWFWPDAALVAVKQTPTYFCGVLNKCLKHNIPTRHNIIKWLFPH